MASLEELEANGELFRVTVKLTPPDRDRRRFYAVPFVMEWIAATLPTIQPMDEYSLSAREQLFVVLERFNSGEALEEGPEYRLMLPLDQDVYELKSADLRIYGWFFRPSVFIAVTASTMELTHAVNGLASGLRGAVVAARNSIDLDPPKYIQGASADDVFRI